MSHRPADGGRAVVPRSARRKGWLGQSVYLRDICGREEGAPPPVDLVAERRHGEFVRALIGQGLLTACHDLSDGGLLVALAEMSDGLAAWASTVETLSHDLPAHAFWFGEDQGRYVIAVRSENIDALATQAAGAGVELTRLGVTGGAALTVPGEEPILVKDLAKAYESWLPAYMARAA